MQYVGRDDNVIGVRLVTLICRWHSNIKKIEGHFVCVSLEELCSLRKRVRRYVGVSV